MQKSLPIFIIHVIQNSLLLLIHVNTEVEKIYYQYQSKMELNLALFS